MKRGTGRRRVGGAQPTGRGAATRTTGRDPGSRAGETTDGRARRRRVPPAFFRRCAVTSLAARDVTQAPGDVRRAPMRGLCGARRAGKRSEAAASVGARRRITAAAAGGRGVGGGVTRGVVICGGDAGGDVTGAAVTAAGRRHPGHPRGRRGGAAVFDWKGRANKHQEGAECSCLAPKSSQTSTRTSKGAER